MTEEQQMVKIEEIRKAIEKLVKDDLDHIPFLHGLLTQLTDEIETDYL